MKAKRLSKAQRMSLDIITTLPQTIIETILCLLPIEEAARTSILTSEWRFKWTKIPKLEFSKSTVCKRTTKENQLQDDQPLINRLYSSDLANAREDMDWRCKLLSAIHQVLLLRQGPIHEFTLCTIADKTCFEIDQIILHLLRNHSIKKLTFHFYESLSYSLPISVFSFHHLTDLHLSYTAIYHKPIFNGFSSLTSLYLKLVAISKRSFLHLLSNCPSLKSLCLFLLYDDFYDEEYPNIIELFKCLPVIERLTTWGEMVELLVSYWVPQELPTSLIHLKYLRIKRLGFDNNNGLVFLGLLMKCSPNLETIKLEINRKDHCAELDSGYLEEYSTILEQYSDVCLENLNELDIKNFRNLKPELDFVKFILTRSPSLKKVILLTWMHDKNEELEMSKILLRAQRASPVEIIVENIYKESDDDDED